MFICSNSILFISYYQPMSISSNLQEVQIRCFGEGPVVQVTPFELDWGNIPVLLDVERYLTLSNESLIPAKFICSTVKHLQFINCYCRKYNDCSHSYIKFVFRSFTFVTATCRYYCTSFTLYCRIFALSHSYFFIN